MAKPAVTHTIDPVAAQAAYQIVVEALLATGVNRAEAIVALLTILGTQYKGDILSPDEMEDFTLQASQWFHTYFVEGDPQ